jgi:inner membrane protein
MDPLSQGIVGGVIAQRFAQKSKIRLAAFCGIISGMVADLDIFIRSSTNDLLSLQFHRHFTHSLFFIPIGSLIIASLLYLLFFRANCKFKQIYFFSFLGYATHGLLDACTSYGTLLYWPILDHRVSWSIISIIDPIFTFSLLIIMIITLVKKSPLIAKIAVIFMALYLSYGFVNKFRAGQLVKSLAEQRGHQIERIFLNPTIANNILWRSIYQSGANYYIDAIYVNPFKKNLMHQGVKIPVIDQESIFAKSLPTNSVARNDIRKFAYFSQNYIYLYPYKANIIADLRYGTLPYDDRSLWGLELDLTNPNLHGKFRGLKNFSKQDYDKFWSLLKGHLK